MGKDEALLHAARAYTRGRSRSSLTWLELSGDIEAYTNPRRTGAALPLPWQRALRVLLASGKCDHLARDRQGRLASELAGVYGRDPAMARLLLRKELQQARTQGLELKRRGQEPARRKSRAVTRMAKDRDRDRER